MSNTIEIAIISIMLYFLCGKQYFINTLFIYGFYMLATKLVSSYRTRLISERFESEIKTENKLFNIIYNISTVKYFQREETESNNFIDIIKDTRSKDEKVSISLSFLNSLQNIIISGGMVINLYMGILDCSTGKLTPGDLVMLQAIFAQIMMPLNFMGTLMREVDETKVNLKYAVEMIENKEKLKQINKENQIYKYEGGKIEFKNVMFNFHSEKETSKNILDDMNIIFEKGTFNAIVGHSGSGKSTIFNLIYKLYNPSNGTILIDDQDVKKLDDESLRKVKFE